MTSSSTVLVIDDELRSREALQRVLADEFDVICVSRAKEAEGVLDGELVQVILCDHRMAGESGVDFLKRARIAWPDPIRIIISGYTESEDIIAGVNEAGIYQYITKPWEPEKLIASVRDAAQL
jgi:two-component system response regulator HupR/HoxA